MDYDYLSLQLAFYLASWGMYRGSSFLLQKDYKVHEAVVKELLDSKYNCLFGLTCKMLRDQEVYDGWDGYWETYCHKVLGFPEPKYDNNQ